MVFPHWMHRTAMVFNFVEDAQDELNSAQPLSNLFLLKAVILLRFSHQLSLQSVPSQHIFCVCACNH